MINQKNPKISKMHRIFFPSILLFIACLNNANAQLTAKEKGFNAITSDAIKAQLGFLASDWTEGREAGQRGEYMAGDYIASMLRLYGVRPGGDYPAPDRFSNPGTSKERTYFQNFYLIKSSPSGEQIMKIKSLEGNTVITTELTGNIDFFIRSAGTSIEIEAPVVFAGYGFRSEKLHHDDFSKLDLKGKLVLKLSGAPGYAQKNLSPSEISVISREAVRIIREMGAAGILEFSPASVIVGSQPQNQFLDMSPSEANPGRRRTWADYSLPGKKSEDNFLHVFISVKTADEILKESGFNLDDFIKSYESDNSSLLPVIREKSVYLKSTVIKETVRVRNVIGIIEGTNPEKVIVLGAHYDHLGMANGYVWNGADDNASGTVGVMTIARAFMESGTIPSKTIIFALWSSEEVGLLGSRYYVENLSYPLKDLCLNVNFDMISRFVSEEETKSVSMVYNEEFPLFRTITEENIRNLGIDLKVDYQPSKNPGGGSDHRSFTAVGIPIMRFKPGHREEYHTPYDEISTIDWDIMEKIIKISFANIWDLANRDW
jgi:hypothetical protein